MGAWGSLPATPPQCLAVNRDRFYSPCRGTVPAEQSLRPRAQLGFQDPSIYTPQDRVKGCCTWRRVGESEGLTEASPIVAAPLGNGRVTPVATQHRTAGQREDGGERVTFATSTT